MYSTKIYKYAISLDLEDLNRYYTITNTIKVAQIAKGENIKVAIFDSGVDIFHKELKNKITGTFNAASNSNNVEDRLGHGTMMAGLINGRISGLAKNVQLYVIKVTDDDNNFKITNDSIIKGIDWCINNNINIICMAFSSYVYNNELEKAIIKGSNKGILFIASAGNKFNDISYPGLYDDVLSIGSIDNLFNNTDFSPGGEKLDLVSIGTNIPSLYSYGRYVVSSGSSVATAIATAQIIILCQLKYIKYQNIFNIEQIRKWLKNNAKDLGELGYDTSYGYGVIDFSKICENGYEINI